MLNRLELQGLRLYIITSMSSGFIPFSRTIIIDDDPFTIIDPGCKWEDLKQGLKKIGRDFKKIKQVILTHIHVDHSWLAHRIKSISGCDVITHEIESQPMKNLKAFKQYHGIIGEPFETSWEEFVFSTIDFKTCPVDATFKGHDSIQLNSCSLQVIHTPGHTSGHSCFYLPDQKVLISGDLDFSSFGPWYGNACSDLIDYISSLNKIQCIKVDYVIPAHASYLQGTDKIKKGFEDAFHIIARRDSNIIQILRRGPLTLDELSGRGIIYNRYPVYRIVYSVFEKNMIRNHLKKLEREGKIRKKLTNSDIIWEISE